MHSDNGRAVVKSEGHNAQEISMIYRQTTLAGCLALVATVFFAQQAAASDATYCEALSAKYREFAGGTQSDAVVADAMAKCKAGDTATGIPILEKFLKDNKVTLPPRT
jgi:hypothetical protein